MKLTEQFLAEVEREAAPTRKTLERVPEGRNDWKPHEKSMQLGYLAQLVASMFGWATSMITLDEMDIAPVGETPGQVQWKTRADLLKTFDESVAGLREALSNTTDEHLLTNWRLLAAGRVVDDSPRYLGIRHNVLYHLAHHRGQLTVYLRLNEASVPAIYGPSADERPAF